MCLWRWRVERIIWGKYGWGLFIFWIFFIWMLISGGWRRLLIFIRNFFLMDYGWIWMSCLIFVWGLIVIIFWMLCVWKCLIGVVWCVIIWMCCGGIGCFIILKYIGIMSFMRRWLLWWFVIIMMLSIMMCIIFMDLFRWWLCLKFWKR